jgi:hypothetical protein
MTKTRDLANLIADSKVGPSEIDTTGTYQVNGLGVGTPASHSLHIKGSTQTNAVLAVESSTWSSGSTAEIRLAYVDGHNRSIKGHYDNGMEFYTNSTDPAMTIDSSGRLLLGTTTSFADGNSEDLQIAGSGDTGMMIKSGTSSYGSIYFGDATSGGARNAGIVRYKHGDDNMQFWTAEGERVRIDSNGNLLVGKTSVGLSNSGVELREGAASGFTRNDTVMDLNRTSSDGQIMRFRKDSTVVGSIGSVSGVDLFVAGNRGAGQRYLLDNILPCNSAGNVTNGDIDLGTADYKYRDLFLGGGVYLGGGVAANKLDDYEQSTFTPEFYYGSWGYSVKRGDIIRIGNLVQVSMLIAWSSSSSTGDVLTVQLPIQSIAVTTARFSGCLGYVSGFDTTTDYKQINPIMSGNSTFINFYRMNDNAAPTYLTNSSCSGSGEVQIAIAFTAA